MATRRTEREAAPEPEDRAARGPSRDAPGGGRGRGGRAVAGGSSHLPRDGEGQGQSGGEDFCAASRARNARGRSERWNGRAAWRLARWLPRGGGGWVFGGWEGVQDDVFTQLRSAFEDELTQQRALKELETLKQGKKPYQEFYTKFARLVSEAEGDDWPDATKNKFFCDALRPQVLPVIRLRARMAGGAFEDWERAARSFCVVVDDDSLAKP